MTHPDLDKLEVALNALKIYCDERSLSPEDSNYSGRLIDTFRAHLAAQRQGGDDERMRVIEEAVSYLHSLDDSDDACRAYQNILDSVRAMQAPAVTGDRGALEALDEIEKIMLAVVGGIGWPSTFKTIRAALLSAQAGVPGDVVEKVADMLQRCQTLFGFDLQHMIKMGEGYNQSVVDVALDVHNTLALLSPYLNTNDGRE